MVFWSDGTYRHCPVSVKAAQTLRSLAAKRQLDHCFRRVSDHSAKRCFPARAFARSTVELRRLAIEFRGAHSQRSGMKVKANGRIHRVELGRHIVADPKICGGQPTFRGTRIMVWIVLEQLDRGLTWAEISREWDGRVTDEAIAEAIAIADFVVKHEPFRGFNVGTRRKRARRPAPVTA